MNKIEKKDTASGAFDVGVVLEPYPGFGHSPAIRPQLLPEIEGICQPINQIFT